jgi:replicative DNA helicase
VIRLPQSREAEQAVIGAILISPESLDRVAGKLSEADFFVPAHRLIWRAACDLAARGQPCDAVTLGEWFDKTGEAESVGGGSYIVELASTTPSAANVEAYAKIVREKSVRRSLVSIGQLLQQEAINADDSLSAADEGMRALMELTQGSAEHEGSLRDALKAAKNDIIEAYEHRGSLRGITSGLERLDQRLGGFHPGDLIIVGARPAMGKTAILLKFADAASGADHSIGLISGEQPSMQVAQRLIASNGPMAAERLRNGQLEEEDWNAITRAVTKLQGRRMRILDRSSPTMDEVARQARAWKRKYGIVQLLVDYVQRIRIPKMQKRNEEVAEVGRRLKDLARELNIAVVALAQVKSDCEARADKRPMQGDLANSDELTREADIIAMLYRDEVYNENTQDKGIAEINIEKNRHGPCGTIKCAWIGESMRFENLAYS